MDTSNVAKRVADDLADVLATIPLAGGNGHLTDHLFDQLVDLLLEGMLVELRSQLTDGELTQSQYATELTTLASQCRAAGLLSRR